MITDDFWLLTHLFQLIGTLALKTLKINIQTKQTNNNKNKKQVPGQNVTLSKPVMAVARKIVPLSGRNLEQNQRQCKVANCCNRLGGRGGRWETRSWWEEPRGGHREKKERGRRRDREDRDNIEQKQFMLTQGLFSVTSRRRPWVYMKFDSS